MTILQPSTAWALPVLRAEAEARMTSTCTITVAGASTWNDTTGTYSTPTATTLYTGKCRLRWGNPAPQDGDSGETSWAVDRTGTLSLPIAGTANIPDGALVTITANPNDPGMVGLELTVLAPHFQTDSIARRLPVQVVSRDA